MRPARRGNSASTPTQSGLETTAMLSWDRTLTPTAPWPGSSPEDLLRGDSSSEAAGAHGAGGSETECRAWQHQFWRELFMAGSVYAAGHLLLGVQFRAGQMEVIHDTPDTARLLFLLGTVLLLRVIRTLDRPVISNRQEACTPAAWCLVTTL